MFVQVLEHKSDNHNLESRRLCKGKHKGHSKLGVKWLQKSQLSPEQMFACEFNAVLTIQHPVVSSFFTSCQH